MRALAITALVAMACSVPEGDIAIALRSYDPVALTQAPITDGKLDLMLPPQGGFVLFVGAELGNVGERFVELRGRVIDKGAVIAEDIRNVPLVESGGVFTPDLRSYLNVSNIAVCPFAGSEDRYDKPFTVEIRVRETGNGRAGTATMPVVLTCRQTDPKVLQLCKCQCEGNFVLGKCV